LNGQGRILLISHDVVGTQMGGSGVRYYRLAHVLAQGFDVVLAVPDELPPDVKKQGFTLIQYTRQDWHSLKPLAAGADVIVFPSDIASDFPQLGESQAFLVVDGHDPLLAEWLALSQYLNPHEQRGQWQQRMVTLNQQYLLGDFFLCLSERQRDWWLGLLEANGRINPWTFGEDPSLRRLIDVVPFGLPGEPPRHTHPVIKGVWPGITKDNRVILWGGGLWAWLDPLTAIRAAAKVWQQRQDVRLIFPATRHPNPWLKGTPNHNEAALQAAQRLGVLNKAVFFGDWVPQANWPSVLLESDIALTLDYDTLETRLAFRCRVLDYIWAGLPIVATRGDETSALIEKYQLGMMVDYENEDAVAEAILTLLNTPQKTFRKGFERARRELTWERAARPLVEFCRHPRRAPDKAALGELLGNPFYVSEIARLRALVKGYEEGRFMRLMRWLHRLKDA
jgi:glycosyltransferase involved in cell wall biosynthesis